MQAYAHDTRTPTCQCMDGYVYNPVTHGCEDAMLARPARSLKQVNPTCPPGCDPSGCVLDSTSGGYKCIFCLGSLLLNTAKGTCECPAGKYGGDDTCADCWKAHYCPGGTYTGPGTPPKTPCPSNMTTTGRRSSSIRACVNAAGTSYDVDAAGNIIVTACPEDTYGPGMKKQRSCVPCPPGYTTNGATGQITVAACVVPEGYYLKAPGQVALCPKGEYKSGFAATASCTKCGVGATTQAAASTSKDDCTILLPSFYADSMVGVAINSTRKCPQSFVCPGGEVTAAFDPTNPTATTGTTVLQCPDGTYTETIGASSTTACMTPPGFKTVNGVTSACAAGEYRPEWKPPAAASACELCGDNINSTAAEQLALYDTSTGELSTVTVRASAASCYIKAGQGMYFSATTNKYYAVNCDSNSYGVPALTYGLAAQPCRDCPGGMQANSSLPNSAAHFVSHGGGLQGYTSPKACVTKAGHGYDGRVSNRCPAGSFNAAGNYDTCKQCQTGLSTPYDADRQVSVDNCMLARGYGFHDNTIVPCPVGTYNADLRTNTTAPCTPCPGHLTTTQAGAESVDDCSMCAAGYGGGDCTTQCGGSQPTFGPAGRDVGSACEVCPVVSYGFFFDYLGINRNYTPNVVARPGASSLGDCLAEFAQIEDVAWFMGGSVDMAHAAASTFESCVAACKEDAACEYLTFDYVAQQCLLKTSASAASASGSVVGYKAVLAVEATSGSVNNAKALASGFYTFWWGQASGIGTSYESVATTSLHACLSACDRDHSCAAVALTGATAAAAPIASCSLIRGNNTVATFKPSATRVVPTRQLLPPGGGIAGDDAPPPANTQGVCLKYRIDTIAGGGPTGTWGMDELDALSADLPQPFGLGIDSQGGATDIYFGTMDSKIFKLYQLPTGRWQLKRFAGNGQQPTALPGADAPALTSPLRWAWGITAHEGSIYFADWFYADAGSKYGLIRKVDANGIMSVFTSDLNGPRGRLVFDADGNMYVLDEVSYSQYTIVRFDAGTKAKRTICSFGNPLDDMVLKDGMLVVTHDWYKIIQVDISDPSTCKYTTIVGKVGGWPGFTDGVLANTGGAIAKPMGVDYDAHGNLIITEGNMGNNMGNRIRRVMAPASRYGGYIYSIAGTGTTGELTPVESSADALQVPLRDPAYGRVASDGSIIFADRDNKRIRRMTCTEYAPPSVCVSMPNNVTNGVWPDTCAGAASQEACTASCHPGYRGIVTAQCGADGMWSQQGTCDAIADASLAMGEACSAAQECVSTGCLPADLINFSSSLSNVATGCCARIGEPAPYGQPNQGCCSDMSGLVGGVNTCVCTIKDGPSTGYGPCSTAQDCCQDTPGVTRACMGNHCCRATGSYCNPGDGCCNGACPGYGAACP